MEKQFTEIAAIEPFYGEKGGNATRIYTRHGEVYEDNRRLNSFMNGLARYFGADLAALRKSYGQYLNCSLHVPIPLSHNLVLVPLKMRQPIFDKDGATGYINVCAVLKAAANDLDPSNETNCCRVYLLGGQSITCLYSPKTTEQRITKGNLARDRFACLHSACQCNSSALVMEKASDDALDKIVTISKFFYELVVEKALADKATR